MAKNANFVSHKKSKLKNQDGSPQLPSASALVEGEIAINFGKDVETLSIKNESGDVVTFSSDNYYSEQKLGSAFTGANSAVTVTDVIEENEEIISAALTDLDERKLDASDFIVDQVIDSGTSASTNAVSTSAVYNAIVDTELVWTNAYVAMSGEVSAHTANTEIHVTAADKEKLHTHSNKSALDSITGNVGTMAYQNASSYSSATEVNTALGNKANTSDLNDFFDDAKYEDSGTTKVINFYHGNTIKATIDASDFIVDGMVEDVRIENGNLVIDFNTASGKQDISIPLTDIFDPSNYYDKDDIDDLVGSGFTSSSITDAIIENEEIVSAALTDLDERKLDASAYTPTDLSNYYTKSETSGATEINNALGGKVNSATFTGHTADTTVHFTTGTVQTQIDNSISGKVNTSDIISAITPSNSGSTNPISTKVVAENELTVSNALNDLDNRKLDASAYTPTDLSNYYTKSDTSGKTEISTALAGKVDTSDLDDYYTKTDIDDKLGSAFTGVNSAVTITDYLESNEETISAALVDLEDRKLDATAYTVNNGILNLQVNGATNTSFTANQSATSTFNITSGSTRGTISAGGTDVKVTALGESIHYLTSTSGTSGGTYLAASWSGNSSEITDLYTGLVVQIKIPIAGHASGVTLSINGGEKHPIFYNNTKLTTQYGVDSVKTMTYDAEATGTYYSGSSTQASVQGVWRCDADYDSNTNTIGYIIGHNQVIYNTDSALYRYMLLFTKSESTLTPVNTSSNVTAGTKTLTTSEFDPFGDIIYYSASKTIAANESIPSAVTWTQNTINLAYSFNTTDTLTAQKAVYIVAVPQSNGKVKLHSSPISQTLPTTDDGLVYIYLGQAYSTTNIYLMNNHPVYQFKDGKLREYTNSIDEFASNKITAMTGYASAGTVSAISTSDTLNQAIGKLESRFGGIQIVKITQTDYDNLPTPRNSSILYIITN